MAKLMMRGYRPLSEESKFALVGATQDISTVKEWLANTESNGLFLHTGFEQIKGEIIRQFTEMARNGIVACAASRTLLSEELPDYHWKLCAGNEGGSVRVNSLPGWYFIANADADADADGAVSEDLHDDARVQVFKPDVGYAPYLMHLTEIVPELLEDIIALGISNDEDLLTLEGRLPLVARISLARIIFDEGLAIAHPHFNEGQSLDDMSSAVIRLAQATPLWMMSELPFITVRVNNALTRGGVHSLGELASMTPGNLSSLPNFGRKSLADVFEFQTKELMRTAERMLGSIQGTSDELTQAKRSPCMPHGAQQNFIQSVQPKQSVYKIATPASLNDIPPRVGNTLKSFCDQIEVVKPNNAAFLRARLQGCTLEAISKTANLTRERIRQIISKTVPKFVNRFDDVSHNADAIKSFIRLLYEENEATPVLIQRLLECVGFDEGFNLDGSDAGTRAVLDIPETIIFAPQFSLRIVTLSGKPVSLPVPHAASLGSPLDEMIDSVDSIFDVHTLDEAILISRNEFMAKGLPPFLSSLFAQELIQNRTVISADGMITAPLTRSEARRATIMRILQGSSTPIHWDKDCVPNLHEILPASAKGERGGATVMDEIRAKTISSSDDYIHTLGYGEYGLWKHIPLDDDDAARIADEVSRFLASNTSMQISDRELLTYLIDKKVVALDKNDRMAKHFISAALFRNRHPKTRYLGRFMWCSGEWTDEPDTGSRVFVHDIMMDAIKTKGRPMYAHELRDAVLEKRGHGVEYLQVIEKNGLVRVGATEKGNLYWNTYLDPFPAESEEVRQMHAEIVELLSRFPQRSLVALKSAVTRCADLVSEYNDAEFFALALRAPHVTIAESQTGVALRYSLEIAGT